MEKVAGVDIGNDSLKVITGDQQDPLVIPNVVVPGYRRQVLQEEDSALEALDVQVDSPAFSYSPQHYFVGRLAVEDEDNFEIEETDNKATSDQSLIVTLTALAYAGVVNQMQFDSSSSDEYEVQYVIGTGLPVRSYHQDHQELEDRLTGEHTVTFHSTPQLKNKKVKIVIKKTFIFIEGAAALYHMATDQRLEVQQDHLFQGCIGVCEIGALTIDVPVIKRMNIDNRFSYGEQTGLASYLDSIIRDVEDEYGYVFPSRAKLVDRLKQKNFTIQLIGEGQADIKPIIDRYFNRAAHRIVDIIKKRWKKCPDIECFYVIGGGGAALREYLTQAAGSITLRFVDNSELQNMYGYYKLTKRKAEPIHTSEEPPTYNEFS